MAVSLPQTSSDLKESFGVKTDRELGNLLRYPDKLSKSQATIWKYSGGALIRGRPLDSTIITMAGPSGAGKSSTINALFNDDTLCKTNDTQSETSSIVLIRKPLEITNETPTLSTTLNFVDVPGTFDTNAKNEIKNQESIRRFKESRIELAKRTEIPWMLRKYYSIPQNVYPNLVLFVVNANDNRMGGPDSILMKTLQVLKTKGDLIDHKRNNLIVVLTHIMGLSPKPAVFIKKLQERKDTIRQSVMKSLGIVNVDIIPIENQPDDYDLIKKGDYYQLPNGEWSHLNLFEKMQQRLSQNQDLLARLSIAWYYRTDCPDKHTKAEIIDTHVNADPQKVGENLQDAFFHLSTNSEQLPMYNVQCIGFGYCPVTEQVKAMSPLKYNGEPEIKEISTSQFLIPAGMSVLCNPMSKFHRLSFFKKQDYEKQMQQSYGFEVGLTLVVSANSDGKWIEENTSAEQHSLISVVHQIQVASLRLPDPEKHPKSEGFQNALKNLPKEYNEETYSKFRAFFSRWGSHLIYEQGLGGSVQLNCICKHKSITEEKLDEIQTSISGFFRQFFNAGAKHNFSNKVAELREMGVVEEHLQISGGDPPPLITMDTLDSEKLQIWADSVASRPSELRHSMKLYPYYHLISGKRSETLRMATEEYLKSSQREKTEDELDQNKIAENNLGEVVEIPSENANCFPKGTQVLLANGTSELIENLHRGQGKTNLATLRLKGMSKKLKICDTAPVTTNFCAYLDAKSTQQIEYICLHFSNGKILRVSPGHVIFQYFVNDQAVIGKQAKHFRVGDRMVFQNSANAGHAIVEYPSVIRISREHLIGAYSPLTNSGTFLADGFLVSSYADTYYFQLGQVSLAPLKLYSRLQVKKESGSCGIHPYAKFLISLRKTLMFYT